MGRSPSPAHVATPPPQPPPLPPSRRRHSAANRLLRDPWLPAPSSAVPASQPSNLPSIRAFKSWRPLATANHRRPPLPRPACRFNQRWRPGRYGCPRAPRRRFFAKSHISRRLSSSTVVLSAYTRLFASATRDSAFACTVPSVGRRGVASPVCCSCVRSPLWCAVLHSSPFVADAAKSGAML